MAVSHLDFSAALHFDYLEGFIVLSYIKRLCVELDIPMPPTVGIPSRNDSIHWALSNLPAEAHPSHLKSTP